MYIARNKNTIGVATINFYPTITGQVTSTAATKTTKTTKPKTTTKKLTKPFNFIK